MFMQMEQALRVSDQLQTVDAQSGIQLQIRILN